MNKHNSNRPTVVIRPATCDDAESIAQVHAAAWQSTYREIMPAEFLDRLGESTWRGQWIAALSEDVPKTFTLVAEHESEIIGFASGGPARKHDSEFAGELYAIYLLEEFQGQGVGTALLVESAASLFSVGVSSMKVWVLKDNPSRAFYERLGGELLADEETIMIQNEKYSEVAYGWRELQRLLDSA